VQNLESEFQIKEVMLTQLMEETKIA